MNKKPILAEITNSDISKFIRNIQNFRHKEKNTALILLIFKLQLSIQQLTQLSISDVALINSKALSLKLLDNITIYNPKNVTYRSEGISLCGRSEVRICFTKNALDRFISQLLRTPYSAPKVDPSQHYPINFTSEDTKYAKPLSNSDLRRALKTYIKLRLIKSPNVCPSDPLFITQRGGSYTPKTMLEHISLLLTRFKLSTRTRGPDTKPSFFKTSKRNRSN